VAGVFQGKSKKETAADGSSVEHRDDKAALKGWFFFLATACLLKRELLTFIAGAGAGNFSAVGAADLEETKKSDAADWREEGKINHI
jgi:hypothetical protein